MENATFDNSYISKCRVCFHEKDDMHSIFKRRKGSSAYDKLIMYTKLNIYKNDGGPSLICVQCLSELETTVNFVVKCAKSNEILASLCEDNCGSSTVLNPKSSSSDHDLCLKNDWIVKDHGAGRSRGDDSIKCTNSEEVPINTRVIQNERIPCSVCGARRRCEHVPASTFSCDICGKHFKKKDNLVVHKKRHAGAREHECAQCGARRYTRGELAAHARTHSRARPHACARCPKRFTSRANLLIHVRRHTGERPHECGDCHKRFISKNTLNIHKRIHTGVKPYMCAVCGKRFASNKLAAHMWSHGAGAAAGRAAGAAGAGAGGALACPRCPRAFASRRALASHARRHAPAAPAAPPAAPLACPRCPHTYSHSQSLNKHLKKHHPNASPAPAAGGSRSDRPR